MPARRDDPVDGGALLVGQFELEGAVLHKPAGLNHFTRAVPEALRAP